MKKTGLLLVLLSLCLTACESPEGYTPTGEFYLKTRPSQGDTGIDYVISVEAERKTYESSEAITVPMEVGLGHLPGTGGYGDVKNTFYVQYRIIEAPWAADKEPAWEKRVEYSDSWYDSKYDSTEQKNPPVLIAPSYGEFYPLYKETVAFVFPANVERGYVQITVFVVIEGQEDCSVAGLEFYFERTDGMLVLNPYE